MRRVEKGRGVAVFAEGDRTQLVVRKGAKPTHTEHSWGGSSDLRPESKRATGWIEVIRLCWDV